MSFDSLRDLLDARADGLALDHATISLTENGYKITGKASVLGKPDQDVSVTFEPRDGKVQPTLEAVMDALTLEEMVRLKLLPGRTLDGELLKTQFSKVQLLPDRERREVTLAGQGPATLGLGRTDFALRQTTLAVRLGVTEGDPIAREAYIGGALGPGAGAPMRLPLQGGSFGWQLAMAPQSSAGVEVLAAARGASVQLPDQIGGLPKLAVSDLGMLFDPKSGEVSALGFTLKAERWPLAGAPLNLAIESIEVPLSVSRSGGVAGSVNGRFTILDADVGITVPLPLGASEWHMEARPRLAFPGLGKLVEGAGKLVGKGDLAASLPPGLREFGNLSIDYFSFVFDPVSKTIRRSAFRLQSGASWQLPYFEKGSLDDIRIDLQIEDPSGARVVTGSVGGTLTLGKIYVPVVVERLAKSEGWKLRVTYDELSVGLEDLLKLVGIDEQQYRVGLPDGLSVLRDLRLISAEVEYDFEKRQPSVAAFSVRLDQPWTLIPDLLSVEEIDVWMRKDFTKSPGLSAGASTTVQIADVTFYLSAQHPLPESDWEFTACMAPGDQIDLTRLLGKLMPQSFKLPTGFPQVQCTGADLSVVPKTGEFLVDLTSQVQWQPPFAKSNLLIRDLRTRLGVGEADSESKRPYRFAVTGKFEFAGLTGAAAFRTSNTDEDTLFAVTVTNEVSSNGLAGVARSLTTGAHDGTETWQSVLPSVPRDFIDLGTLKLSLAVNLTKNVFFAHGSSSTVGSVAFLARDGGKDGWGYFVAARLAEGFKFKSLAGALEVVDSVLTVKQAAFAFSSFKAPALRELVAPFKELSDAVPACRDGDALEVVEGVNFYAEVDLAKGLFPRVQKIGAVAADPATRIVLWGRIPREADKSEFGAKLSDLKFSDEVVLEQVALRYRAADKHELALKARLRFTVSDRQLLFAGAVKLNDERAHFEVEVAQGEAPPAPQSLPNPMGMPGKSIVLRELRCSLDIEYEDKAQHKARRVDARLHGEVHFFKASDAATPVAKLSGDLVLEGGKPVLVAVKLEPNKPLRIEDFFNTVFGDKTWPAGFIDIAFVEGEMSYTKAAGTYLGKSYPEGFVVRTAFELFSEHKVDIRLSVVPGKGVEISGWMSKKIDLSFIEFTGPDFQGSPLVGAGTTESAHFRIETGIRLLKEDFVSAKIDVRKANGAAQLAGKVTYPKTGAIEVFRDKSLEFTYDCVSGFLVKNWPIDLKALKEFEEAYQAFAKIYERGGCVPLGKVINLIFEKALSTDFKLNPGLEQRDGRSAVIIRGRYEISVKGQSQPFLYVALPELAFFIPDNLTLRGLPEALGHFLVGSAGTILKSIYDDPGKYAALLATVLGRQALEKLGDNLFCFTAQTAEQAAAAARAQQAAEAAAALARAAATAAEAEAAAEAAAVAAAAVGAGLAAAAAAAIASAFKDKGRPDKPKTVKLWAPPWIDLSYDARTDQVTVTWGPTYAPDGYKLQLMDDSFRQVAPNADRKLVLAAGSLHAGANRVQVQAAAEAKHPELEASDWTAAVITRSAAPAAAAIRYLDGSVLVSWGAAADAARYEVQVLRDGGDFESLHPVAGGSAATQVSLPTAGWPAGSYAAKVRALSRNEIPGPWGGASRSLIKPASPVIQEEQWDAQSGKVVVVLAPASRGDRFSARLVSADGRFAGAPQTAAPGERLLLSVPDDLPAGEYMVQARAEGAAEAYIASEWGASPRRLARLAPPTVASLVWQAGTQSIVATIAPSVPPSRHAAQLLAVAVAYGAEREFDAATLAIALPVGDLPAGACSARVRAMGANDHQLPSSWAKAAGSIARLAPPQVSAASYSADDARIHVTFAAPPGPAKFVSARLVSAQGAALAAPTRVALPATTIALGVEAVPAGPCSLQLRAEADSPEAVDSAWAAPPWTDLRRLGATENLQVRFVRALEAPVAHVLLQFKRVPDAQSYGVALLDEQGRAMAPAPAIQTVDAGAGDRPVKLQFDGMPYPAGKYKVSVRAQSADPHAIAGAAVPSALFEVTARVQAPAAPTGLRIRYMAEQRCVTVSWAVVDTATGYEIEALDAQRRPLVLDPPTAGRVTASSTTFSVSTWTRGAGYSVRVRALNGDLASPWSDAVSMSVPLAAPGIPSGIDAVRRDEHIVQVSWAPVQGAKSYALRALGPGDAPLNDLKVTDVSGPSAVLGSISPIVKVQVAALGVETETLWSAPCVVRRGPALPPWPVARHDVQRSGRSPLAGPPAGDFEWSVDLESAAPAISLGADGTAYVADGEKLRAFAPDGRLRWSINAGGPLLGAPEIGGDALFFATADSLVAVTPRGIKLWEYRGFSRMSVAPTLGPDGNLYVASIASVAAILALEATASPRPADFTPRSIGLWQAKDLQQRVSGWSHGPAGRKYLLTDGAQLCAFNAPQPSSPGSYVQVWAYPASAPGGKAPAGHPAVGADGTIHYVVGDTLIAVGADGKLRWQYSANTTVLSGPAGNSPGALSPPAIGRDGTLYVQYTGDRTMPSVCLLAIDAKGKLKWRQPFGMPALQVPGPAPVIDRDGLVYVGAREGSCSAFSPGGEQLWTSESRVAGCSALAIGRGRTLYVAGNRKLHAYRQRAIGKISKAGALSLGDAFGFTAVTGTTVIAGADPQLCAIDIADPRQPRKTIGFGNGKYIRAVVQNALPEEACTPLLYACGLFDGQWGLEVYDLSTLPRRAPPRIGSLRRPHGSSSVTAAMALGDGLIVCAEQEFGLQPVDVTNPRQPKFLEKIACDRVDTFAGVLVEGRVVYAASWVYGLKIFRWPGPGGALQPLGALGGVYVQGMAKAGDVLFGISQVVEGASRGHPGTSTSSRFCAMDIADPAKPGLIAEVTIGHACVDIVIAGAYAFLTGSKASVLVLDISDPARPSEVAVLDGEEGRAIAVAGRRVVTSWRGIRVFDLS